MGPRYSTRLFRKVLVPVLHEGDPEPAISAALMITDASNVVLVGVVGILDEESLSAAALPAREVRGRLHDLGRRKHVRSLERIRVSHRPWSELLQIVDAEQPDLLILAASQLARLNATTPEALRYPPCDTIIAYGLLVDRPADVMCALRGGPYAELTLRLGLAIARTSQARLTALHLAPAPMPPVAEPAFKGVDRVLRNLPSVARKYIETDSPAEGILKAANDCDLLVLGASARSEDAVISVGPVAENVLQERSKGVLVVKSSRPIHADMDSESVGQTPYPFLWTSGSRETPTTQQNLKIWTT